MGIPIPKSIFYVEKRHRKERKKDGLGTGLFQPTSQTPRPQPQVGKGTGGASVQDRWTQVDPAKWNIRLTHIQLQHLNGFACPSPRDCSLNSGPNGGIFDMASQNPNPNRNRQWRRVCMYD